MFLLFFFKIIIIFAFYIMINYQNILLLYLCVDKIKILKKIFIYHLIA